MGRRVDVPLVIGFTWGCLSVDLRCVQWREGCRFGDFLVRCSVFCDYWFFYSVCLFVCLFFFSYQRLFNILLSWQHVPMPVIRFRIWRKFICIKSPWETHDSGPCLNGSSIINNLFMFCLWKISAVDKHVFWCHFQMYDDYLSCCCFWKIKDSWFLIPDNKGSTDRQMVISGRAHLSCGTFYCRQLEHSLHLLPDTQFMVLLTTMVFCHLTECFLHWYKSSTTQTDLADRKYLQAIRSLDSGCYNISMFNPSCSSCKGIWWQAIT